MSGTPVKKLPASPRVSSPSVPVTDRGGEEVDVGFCYLRAGGGDQLRDLRLRRSAGNDRKFSLGNRFHTVPLLYHIKDVMFYSREQTKGKQIVTLRILWHKILLDIWHNGELFGRASWTNSRPCRNRRRSRFQDLRSALTRRFDVIVRFRQNTCRGRTLAHPCREPDETPRQTFRGAARRRMRERR